MRLEDQCCSLDQSKRLSELGIKAKSLFYWREYLDENVNKWQAALLLDDKTDDESIKYSLADSSYPAFTVAELGVMLPTDYYSYAGDSCKDWYCLRHGDESNYSKYEFAESPNEAQARASMLIYLLENNLTTSKEVNDKLKN